MGSRIAETFRARLPHDTWDAAQIPAGVRLEFVSWAQSVILELETGPRHDLGAPTMTDAVSVWSGQERIGAVPVPGSGGAVTVPVRADGGTYVLYPPEALRARVVSVAPVGGTIEPTPAAPRWIAYGDSITQGWSASDPGSTYSALAARRLGLDVWNFGFAGSGRGETVVAQQIAELEADIVTLAFGTNNHAAIPTGPAHLAGQLADFVAVVRSGHPHIPIVVLDPILRPASESSPNVMGATLAELRAALRAEARRLAAADPLLRVVEGLPLVTADQLADGIHPTDEGHRAMADALIPVLAEVGIRNNREVTR